MKQNQGIWWAFNSFWVRRLKSWKTNRTISRRHVPSPDKNQGGSRAPQEAGVPGAAPGAAVECVATTVVGRSEAMEATGPEVNAVAIGPEVNVAATEETTTVSQTTAQIDRVRKLTAQIVRQAAALHNTTTVVESNKVVQTLPTGGLRTAQIAASLDAMTAEDALAQT